MGHLKDINIIYQNSDRYTRTPTADLPIEFLHAGFLNRDLNTWLLLDYTAYRGNYGYTIGSILRMLSRGRSYRLRSVDFRASRPVDEPQFSFVLLIAEEEIEKLGLCRGLTKRLAEVIIAWADEGTDGWIDPWFAPRWEMADALEKVIRMGRLNPGPMIDGRPAGQAAFALLSTRFADTPAARRTRYWYHEDHGCRG